MDRISFKGVVLGMLLVLFLDLMLGSVLMISMGGNAIDFNAPEEQVLEAIDVLTRSSMFLLMSVILGTITTVVGGYVCARIAKKYPYFNSAAIGLLGIILGIFVGDNFPWWFNLLSYGLSIPAALLGGHLVKSRIAKNA